MTRLKILHKLDSTYSQCKQSNLAWKCIRFGIRVLINIYARWGMPIGTKNAAITEQTIIVSLTSFPARIKNIWITCATLLNQYYENIHIVLWLSKEQFPEGKKSLPKSLVNLTNKGLDIRFVDDDLRPHKKYFYSFKTWPNNCIITVDDDIIYNPNIVDKLVTIYKQFPKCVICNRGVKISHASYSHWEIAHNKLQPTYGIMPTGIGGVLYPPLCYDVENMFDVDTIKKTCLHGDDLWLNLMTRRKNTQIVLSGFRTGLVTILSSQESALCNTNVLSGNRNDEQITNLNIWCKKKLGCDYYINL